MHFPPPKLLRNSRSSGHTAYFRAFQASRNSESIISPEVAIRDEIDQLLRFGTGLPGLVTLPLESSP